MNPAALARYANAGQPIGHAGPDAPIHADERIALADLPLLADSPQAAADGFRAAMLQRDREQRERRPARTADELSRHNSGRPQVLSARRVVALARVG